MITNGEKCVVSSVSGHVPLGRDDYVPSDTVVSSDVIGNVNNNSYVTKKDKTGVSEKDLHSFATIKASYKTIKEICITPEDGQVNCNLGSQRVSGPCTRPGHGAIEGRYDVDSNGKSYSSN